MTIERRAEIASQISISVKRSLGTRNELRILKKLSHTRLAATSRAKQRNQNQQSTWRAARQAANIIARGGPIDNHDHACHGADGNDLYD